MASLDLERRGAHTAYDMFWGKPMEWQKGTVDIPADNDDYPWSDPVKASQYSFEYIDVKPLVKALALRNFNKSSDNVYLVRRAVYDTLVKALEEGSLSRTDALVITGHPGIGKSFFLLFLLMHRLQKREPTAFQYHSTHYFLFDDKGGTALDGPNLRLERCWALTDSNQNVRAPGEAFQSHALRNILSSSPKAERWKDWQTQAQGTYIVVELPTMEEIVAVMFLRDALPSAVIRLVRTWGPSLRVVGQLLDRPGDASIFSARAKASATALCTSPALLESRDPDVLTSIGSTLLFVRPCPVDAEGTTSEPTFEPTSESRSAPSYEPSSEPTPESSSKTRSKCSSKTTREPTANATLFVPTRFLSDMLHAKRTSLANAEALKLFFCLSKHSLTRTGAGWVHEQAVHTLLATGQTALTIERGAVQQQLQPSSNLLHGTLAAMAGVRTSQSFYCIPAATNFPGVDGVLGDGQGNLYAVQATIADDHESPANGLVQLWSTVKARKDFTWHVVFITFNQATADRYVGTYQGNLSVGTGQASHTVTVWGCHLS